MGKMTEIARKHCTTYAATNIAGAKMAYFGDVVNAIDEATKQTQHELEKSQKTIQELMNIILMYEKNINAQGEDMKMLLNNLALRNDFVDHLYPQQD